ncbi:hypothetical protein GQ607_017568 [Colletotrichum asianum]|uniref:Uncharacterized protein n=1 Tax=Colletotrichum asianum TaxID=702518 RepID=A0A8H3ZDM4_9PEZI|nr:hypothetical protein GQ607_017568 [Colletotrichum asianum]
MRDSRSTQHSASPHAMYEGETRAHTFRDLVAFNAESEPELEPRLTLDLDSWPLGPLRKPEDSTALV